MIVVHTLPTMDGSSPRVWGTFRRIFCSAACCAVHPHVCGEHGRVCGRVVLGHGSSPRVWGTCDFVRCVRRVHRFIPTCVGNILIKHWEIRLGSVHPHVCGEHLLTPPCLAVQFRFIPTCVGNIKAERSSKAWDAVHPHVCGEHLTAGTPTAGGYGSSPRVWGTYH